MFYNKAIASLSATALLLLTSFFTLSQPPLNLDFEYYDDESQLPWGWYIIEKQGCSFAYDTLKSMHGKASLKVYPTTRTPCSFLILNSLDRQLFVNRHEVLITGYGQIRRHSKEVSIVSKQFSSDGKEVLTPFAFGKEKKTHGWTKLRFQQLIDPSTEQFVFGLKGTIRDTVRFDVFQVDLDGAKVVDTKSQARTPQIEEVDWLNKNIIPINPERPFEPAAAKALIDVFGDSRVLGLGEVTHGSSEVYEAKRHLAEFLIAHANFSLLVMEMDMGEAELLNNYVLTGEGDPEKLLLSTSYWIWQTSEFTELLKSMRNYNLRSETNVRIAGIDIPVSDVTLESIRKFGKHVDANVLIFADSISSRFARLRVNRGNAGRLISQIDSLDRYVIMHRELLINRTSDRQFSFLRQSIGTLKQSVARLSDKMSLHYRDSCMAVNMDWLLRYYPHSRAILWAHNEHIMKGEKSLGDFISKTYSTFSVGFALGYGWAMGVESLGASVAPRKLHPPVTDSYESYFMMTKSPVWFLNLQNKELHEWKDHWLNDVHRFRFCGSVIADSYQFAYIDLTKLYDGIIFIRESSASHRLK
jgi:erythromycin esterase